MRTESTSIRLKKLMDERNLKQVDILALAEPYAKLYGVKLNKSDLSQYLSGKTEPRQDKLYVLSQALRVSEAWLMGFYDFPSNNSLSVSNKSSIVVNVLGRVAAGIPIDAIEDIVDTEEVPAEMAKGCELFGLRIKGDSMSPTILSGDTAIIRRQDDAETDEIVIALINGDDAVCKKLKKLDNGIMLISLNPAYEPLVFTTGEIDSIPVRIIGKVVELRRKF